MTYGFFEIDHLLASAVDPYRGGDQYERLGFTVTPISIIESLGVGNRLVLLRPLTDGTAAFFECMGVVDPEHVAPAMASLLDGHEGIRSMVLASSDVDASREKLLIDGHTCDPPIDVEREWELPSGEVLRPAFRVTLPVEAPLRFNFCSYRTLHLYLRDAWLRHDNGARHLTDVFAVAHDAASVAGYFERIFASSAARENGIHSVGPGRVRLRIGDRASLQRFLPGEWLPAAGDAARYAGFGVEVESLPALRALLDGRGVELREHGGAICVAPRDACGNIIRFTEAGRA